MKRSFISAALLLALTASTAVEAQTRTKSLAQNKGAEPKVDGTGPSYSVEFVDDALNALGPDAWIPRIVVRPHVRPTTLIRPRTSFVTELSKSAESY